jgi:ribosomal protein S18 acetylase RimI-like enzyme
VLALYRAIGWGDRSAVTDFYARRADTGLVVLEQGGRVVGCGGATVFGTAGAGPPTGWVHGIAVSPTARGRGLGGRLTEAAVAWLRARGVGTVLLLATDLGRPVYDRMGFTAGERCGNFEWPAGEGAAPPSRVRRARASDLPAVVALDREATGEDRSAFIGDLRDGLWVIEAAEGAGIDGFHLVCPWGPGPSVARDPAAGVALLTLARRLGGDAALRLGVPEPNAAAVQHLGLAPTRHVTRMWLGGPPPAWRPAMIFGVFNFGVA